jgi:ATP-binding protein involved in chromosome partitioning
MVNIEEIKLIIAEIQLEQGKLSDYLADIIVKDEVHNLVFNIEKSDKLDIPLLEKVILSKLSASNFNNKKFKIIISASRPTAKALHRLPNIKKIILVAAAKGGVGKSTCATNIALAMAQLGKKIGLIDADIYGPTVPKLLGIAEKSKAHENKLIPIEKYGIHSISIGNLIDEDKATIWRGPMVSKALFQLVLQVNWPDLDCLVIDMPPGTGDVYLSLAQNFAVDGVVLVSTPQNIATSMLKKSINFFDMVNIPIIGLVENMSYYIDENGNKNLLFGPGLAKESFNFPVLGKVPLYPKISEFGDLGKVLPCEYKEFEPFLNIAQQILPYL